MPKFVITTVKTHRLERQLWSYYFSTQIIQRPSSDKLFCIYIHQMKGWALTQRAQVRGAGGGADVAE